MKNKLYLILVLFSFLISPAYAQTDSVNVTFRVNLAKETGNTTAYLIGDFQNWSLSSNPMTSVGNGVFQTTVRLKTGTTVEYKFAKGTTSESIPAGCASSGNRSLIIPATDTILPKICFGSCTPCMANITFKVDLSTTTLAGGGIKLAGNFNNWSTTATTMFVGMGQVYSASVSLPMGDTAYYNFVNGSTMETVTGDCTIGGHRYTIPVKDSTLAVPCFASCGKCMTNVTFQVDMSNETTIAPNVYVAGNFQGWNPTASKMTTTGNKIYTFTAPVPTKELLLYKFINGTTWENITGTCLNDGNRFSETINGASVTLPVVCFKKCESCKTTGINEMKSLENFEVAPSMIRENFTIKLSSLNEKVINISINDIYGRSVKDLYNGPVSSEFNKEFSTAELESGIYFVNVSGRDGRAVKKILIQK